MLDTKQINFADIFKYQKVFKYPIYYCGRLIHLSYVRQMVFLLPEIGNAKLDMSTLFSKQPSQYHVIIRAELD